MLRHRCRRRHAIELLELFAIPLDRFACRLLRPREDPAHHDEISTTTEGLGRITWACDTAVCADEPTEAVGGISALDHRRELRVAHARLLTCGADRSWSDAHLDDVCTMHYEFLCHLVCHHVTCHDRVPRPPRTHVLDCLHKKLRVSICDIKADESDLWACGKDGVQLVHIRLRSTRRHGNELADVWVFGSERFPLIYGVVLVHRNHAPVLCELYGHAEGAYCIHVGHDHWNTCPLAP
mmetsp:Transcript_68358/g.152575  ORF Transcript_68358/g.152575 Transcript_68358/m.152575 type:complete len:238 (+) Transcript_68358:792-1505(+)